MRMKAAKSLTNFRNKDGQSELMFRYVYENESSKVINLHVNSFGCGLNTQKNALSKTKSRTVRKADQPAELHGNNFPLNRAYHNFSRLLSEEK